MMSPTSISSGSAVLQIISEPPSNVPFIESVVTIIGKMPPMEGTSSLLVRFLMISVQLIITIGISITHRIMPMMVKILCLSVPGCFFS